MPPVKPEQVTTASLRSPRTRRESRCQLRVSGPHERNILVGNQRFELKFNAETVKTINTAFVDILDDIRRKLLANGDIDFKGRGYDFLSRLQSTGSAAFQKLWPHELKKYIDGKEAREEARGLSFTFLVEEEFSLFWEMLYRGSPLETVDPGNFWGLRYPIGRGYFGVESLDRVDLQSGILSAIHNKLTLSLREVQAVKAFLAKLRKVPSVNLKMLDDALDAPSPTTRELLELFHDPEFPFGMVHFACHCDAGQTPLSSSLRITSRSTDIDLLLEQVLGNADYGFQNHPFVFLNACQTADIDGLRAALGFPRAVLDFGAAGVIATACVVPDLFASAFAKEFYRKLLTRPAAPATTNIATVLMETRQHFLTEFENPMGLAYGLYAGSDQEFRI
jgi:CHAT domain